MPIPNFMRRTALVDDNGNVINPLSSVPGSKVGVGKFFIASSGRMTLAAAGNLRAIIQNPAGSGKTVNVARMAAFATATGYATIYLNPTIGVPTVAPRPYLNAVAGGGLPALATLRVDTDLTVPLSGGTNTGLVIGVPANARSTLDLPPIVLAAGVSMGLSIPFAGAADATLSIYWWED